ncbi:MAG: hypothetical protein R6U98_14220 [Pirellulaceae bacterium]
MLIHGKRWDNERAFAKLRGKKIRSLELFDTSVDDIFLADVARAGSLTSLHVASELITDAGIIAVTANCKIKSLLLSGVPNVTDRALESLAQCKTIRELYLDGTAITDRGLALVRYLPDIWSLVIDNTAVTDSGIRELASRRINLISFANCDIEGIGFSTWEQPEKMSFYCDGSNLTETGFAVACASFTYMWNVIISNTHVGDAGIKSLAGQSPTMLRINGTPITRSGVEWIVENLPVEGLEIDERQMSSADAESFPKPRRLDVRVLE